MSEHYEHIVNSLITGSFQSEALRLIEDGVEGHPFGRYGVLLPDGWKWCHLDVERLRYVLAAHEIAYLNDGMNASGYVVNFHDKSSAHYFRRIWPEITALVSG